MEAAHRFAEIALACLEDAFLLCIPESGNHIQVAEVAKRMGLRDSLVGETGLELAHAIARRLEGAERVERWTDGSGRVCVTRLEA